MVYGSVCSGIEAATLAWHWLGWRASFFSEIEKFPRAVLAHRWPDVPLLGDLNHLYYDNSVNLLFSVHHGSEEKGTSGGDRNVFEWFICSRCSGLLWRKQTVNVGLVKKTQCENEEKRKKRRGQPFLSKRVEDRENNTPDCGKSVKKRIVDPSRELPRVRQKLCTCKQQAANRSTSRQLQSPAERALALSKMPLQMAQDQHADPTFVNCSDMNLLVGGFPCQDLSVSGNRKGLIDDDGKETRSGLFFRISELAEAIKPRWTLLENVPGILSSKQGKDFAAVVSTLAGAKFSAPRNGWRNTGFVIGPLGLIEWRVIDARFFGVPQRRRRVYIIKDSGDWWSRGPILLEPQSLRGDIAPYAAYPTLDASMDRKWGSNQWVRNGFCIIQNGKPRRPTVIEAERLQGMPDNWTRIPWRNKGADQCPDGPRYKAIGNSMAVPVMRWIGERIQMFEDS